MIDEIQNGSTFGEHVRVVKSGTSVHDAVEYSVLGDSFRVADDVDAAIVTVFLLQALNFHISSRLEGLEETGHFVGEVDRLSLISSTRRIEVKHFVFRSGVHHETPVASARKLGLLVVVEGEKNKVSSSSLQRLQENADLVLRGDFDALRHFGTDEEQLGIVPEQIALHKFEIERYQGIVEPIGALEKFHVRSSQQTLVETQNDRVVVHLDNLKKRSYLRQYFFLPYYRPEPFTHRSIINSCSIAFFLALYLFRRLLFSILIDV